MKNMSIIPASRFNEVSDSEDIIFMNYCYLHGELSDDCGCDMFAIVRDGLLPHGGKQIIAFQYEGKDCLFFYWTSRHHNTLRDRGLVVYQSDVESVEYAQECYDGNAVSL